MPGTFELLRRHAGGRRHGLGHAGPLQQQRPPGQQQGAGQRAKAILSLSVVWRIARIISSIVLLALAATFDSPLYPGHKQNQPSDTCRRPELFQSWLAVSMVVLVCYILSSGWTKARETSRGRPRTPPPADLEAARPRPLPLPAPLQRVRSAPDAAAVPPPAAQSRAILSHSSPTVHHLYQAPSLYLSNSSLSAGTPGPSTPALSSPNSPEAMVSPSALASTYSLGSLGVLAKVPEGEPMQQLPSLPVGSLPPALLNAAAAAATTEPRPRPDSALIPDSRAQSRAASRGPYPAPYLTAPERNAVRRAEIARKVDKVAARADALMVPRIVLFVLGNVLIFHPWPSTTTTCYNSAPLLWWAVFVGVIDDWVRIVASSIIGAVFFTVYFIYHALLAAYDTFAIRMGWRPPRPPTNTRMPQPLATADLLRCKKVCYVPDPSDPASDDGHSVREGEAVAPDEIDRSRLPLPAVVLPAHRAVCGVCQENFAPPREVARIMYKVPELRQLPCDHVFHESCVDEWLLNHSDACPYCTQSVREGLQKLEVARSAAASRVSLPQQPTAAASRPSLHTPGSQASLAATRRTSRTSNPAVTSQASLGHYPAGARTSALMSQASLASPSPATRAASRMSVHNPSMSQASLAHYPATGSRVSIQYPAGTRTSIQVRAVSRASMQSNPAASQVSLGHYPTGSLSQLGYPGNYPLGYPSAAAASASRTSLVYQHRQSRGSFGAAGSSASLAFYPPSTTRVSLNVANGSTTSLYHPAASSHSLTTPSRAASRTSHTRTVSATQGELELSAQSTTSLGVEGSPLMRSASASRVSLTTCPPAAASSGSLVTVPAAVSRAARASLAENLAEQEREALRNAAKGIAR